MIQQVQDEARWWLMPAFVCVCVRVSCAWHLGALSPSGVNVAFLEVDDPSNGRKRRPKILRLPGAQKKPGRRRLKPQNARRLPSNRKPTSKKTKTRGGKKTAKSRTKRRSSNKKTKRKNKRKKRGRSKRTNKRGRKKAARSSKDGKSKKPQNKKKSKACPAGATGAKCRRLIKKCARYPQKSRKAKECRAAALLGKADKTRENKAACKPGAKGAKCRADLAKTCPPGKAGKTCRAKAAKGIATPAPTSSEQKLDASPKAVLGTSAGAPSGYAAIRGRTPQCVGAQAKRLVKGVRNMKQFHGFSFACEGRNFVCKRETHAPSKRSMHLSTHSFIRIVVSSDSHVQCSSATTPRHLML